MEITILRRDNRWCARAGPMSEGSFGHLFSDTDPERFGERVAAYLEAKQKEQTK